MRSVSCSSQQCVWQQFYSLELGGQIQFPLEYTVRPPPSSRLSGADEHQAGGVDEVGQVEEEVDGGEHGHCHVLVPLAQPYPRAAGGGSGFRAAVLGVEVEDGPDDGRRQVEDDGQQGVARQEARKREGQAVGALADAEQDDDGRQDEADAVDRHAVPERVVAVVQGGVADEDEDDAGQEGLTDLQEPGRCGHVAGDLTWPSFGEAHLAHVGDGGQAGEDGAHNAEVAHLALASASLEEVEREDDGGRQAEEGGVAGEGDGEVLPGHGGFGLQAEKLHQENQESAGEAEGPAEDAEVPGAVVDPGSMHGHGEGHAGEGQGSQPSPQQRARLQDDSHVQIDYFPSSDVRQTVNREKQTKISCFLPREAKSLQLHPSKLHPPTFTRCTMSLLCLGNRRHNNSGHENTIQKHK